MNLRDALLSSLKSLPGTREFHLHVLVSAPRKHADLFYYAIPRPKTYVQDILILLSEQSSPSGPRLLVTGIEAVLYFLPATSSAILYICKVDSTGQAAYPSPTAPLVRALVGWYASPATRPVPAHALWVHVFARAQNQYLFPNSSEWPGKKWLGDVRLCAWWRRLLADAAADFAGAAGSTPSDDEKNRDGEGTGKARTRLCYILPGMSALEAERALRAASGATAGAASADAAGPAWYYGHPYAQTEIPLPCPAPKDTSILNLGNFIPYFEDDPKSRFLDEIAHTTDVDGVRSPKKKKRRLDPALSPGSGAEGEARHASKKERAEDDARRPEGELARVRPDEFWERMSFRQECVSGAITGFFVLALYTPPSPSSNQESAPSPLAPRAGEVSQHVVKRVLGSLMKGNEFSTRERAVRATETIESAIRGLCEGAPSTEDTSPSGSTSPPPRPRTPEPATPVSSALALPHTPPRAQARLPDISPNPFPEPTPTPATYAAHIYGSLKVTNAPLARPAPIPAGDAPSTDAVAPQVTVLTARKKPKKAAARPGGAV